MHVPENKETSVHSSARDSYMHNTCMHESNDVCFAPSEPGLLPQIADSSDIVGHHGPRPSPSSLNLSLLHASVHVTHAAKPLYVFAAAAAHVFVVLALAVIVHSQGSWLSGTGMAFLRTCVLKPWVPGSLGSTPPRALRMHNDRSASTTKTCAAAAAANTYKGLAACMTCTLA